MACSPSERAGETSTVETSTVETSSGEPESRSTTTAARPSSPNIEIVVHVSIDGLRSVDVVADVAPTLARLAAEGTSTLNARTDADNTSTLPNHISQLTGRPVNGPDGHRVEANDADIDTVHRQKGSYIASVFDVVHDHGLATSAFVSKEKMSVIDRSWNETTGAPDVTGSDEGNDKIDEFLYGEADLVANAATMLLARAQSGYVFVHLQDPDVAGHADDWGSEAYLDVVKATDLLVAMILDEVEANPDLAGRVALLVTSDHGGTPDGAGHGRSGVASNFTIPMILWGPGIGPSGDLYALNNGVRTDPESSNPSIGASEPGSPIRGHDAANIVLDLLGLPAVPGSSFNAEQNLALGSRRSVLNSP